MRSNLVRLGFAAAAILAIGMFSVRDAAAVPVPAKTLSFDGFVTDVTDPSNATGLNNHDHITGSITFSPVANDPSASGPLGNQFDETGSFTLSGPSTGPFGIATGNGGVDSSSLFGSTSLILFMGDFGITDNIQLAFSNAGSYNLDHLASLPGDALELGALLGAGFHGSGVAHIADATILFNVITPTPIPGTIWLFVSALGGLGLLGWVRRNPGLAGMAQR